MVSRLQTAPPHIVAFMDLGTNSVRLSLVRINPNHSYTVLSQQREMVRLGDGEFLNDHLQQEAMDRAVRVCTQFAALARSYGAQEIMAVATSATREAENQAEFLRRLQVEAQVDMRVISGSEEARLIYQGVSSGIHLGDKTALFIDIGGGSTEIIVGDQQNYHFIDSLKLGAIRLSNLYLDKDEPVSDERYALIQRHARNAAIRDLQRLREYPLAYVVGSSGTIENLANVAMHHFFQRPWHADDVVTLEQLRAVICLLRTLPLEERRKVPGLNPDRADIIIGGAAVLETLMGEVGLTELRVSTRGLRDGLLVEYLARTDYAPSLQELSVRERSVLHLGRICAFDEIHARHVACLAGELFDSAAEVGLHDFGSWERELCAYAALLHDLGAFLSYHNHQAHTYYFIRNAELLGFDQTEIAIMATTALFHRKTFPRKKHPEFAALDARSQGIVRVLCVLLRMAESLDRAHAGVIEHARLRRVDEKQVMLELCATRECQLELWGIGNHREAFRKVFATQLIIGPGDDTPPPTCPL
ncbi:MAG TPA: Ppx/GppA phosphatase family protein [Armatimonadota bacterium]|jgi:exopolyphosphatase/guanosine-5'-triphosphate,3'-diphosphate pyrophosphatase